MRCPPAQIAPEAEATQRDGCAAVAKGHRLRAGCSCTRVCGGHELERDTMRPSRARTGGVLGADLRPWSRLETQNEGEGACAQSHISVSQLRSPAHQYTTPPHHLLSRVGGSGRSKPSHRSQRRVAAPCGGPAPIHHRVTPLTRRPAPLALPHTPRQVYNGKQRRVLGGERAVGDV